MLQTLFFLFVFSLCFPLFFWGGAKLFSCIFCDFFFPDSFPIFAGKFFSVRKIPRFGPNLGAKYFVIFGAFFLLFFGPKILFFPAIMNIFLAEPKFFEALSSRKRTPWGSYQRIFHATCGFFCVFLCLLFAFFLRRIFEGPYCIPPA